MLSQKIENLLNLALDATPEERRQSLQLNVGFDTAEQTCEVIVQYQGDIALLEEFSLETTLLLGNYAILRLPVSLVETVSLLPQITYMEKPKRLYFAVSEGKAASCITAVQSGAAPVSRFNEGLFGSGVLVACIDSGVDYSHPDFRNPDGTSRLLCLWDQTVPGNPPSGYHTGTLYTREEINAALAAGSAGDVQEQYRLVPSRDVSGHGTAVLGIAAGNGLSSQGTLRGVASESPLAVVKLGTPEPDGFPRTTQLMQGLDFIIRLSMELQMPVAVNISFGNSYGSHSGDSLISTYINTAASFGQCVVCIGTGNEGVSGNHISGVLSPSASLDVELGVGPYESTTNLQIWKNYADEIDIELIHPGGAAAGPIRSVLGPVRFQLQNTELLAFYGMPSPFSTAQEIYLDFLPAGDGSYIDNGSWTVRLTPKQIADGAFHMWLPGGGSLGTDTRFYRPVPETTLTVPSATRRAVSVGAYNSALQSYADFSGRGFTRSFREVKPDLAAPGVGIRSVRSGGGYGSFTGTSFATPFVTGAAALLMEWGIVRGNDPFLYGEKVKAYLIRGARRLPGYGAWPNPELGWGVLCLRDSFPI